MTAITLTGGAPGARILGFGSYRPRRRVTNDDLARTMDTNDEWIQARVGIAERRWAEPDETLLEMSVAAGGKALAASGLDAAELDLVLLASASLPRPIPGLAPEVAHRYTAWPAMLMCFSSSGMAMASCRSPSLPQTVGPTRGSSEGPSTTAPAPSAKITAVDRSLRSVYWVSFSPPMTSACRAVPARIWSAAVPRA